MTLVYENLYDIGISKNTPTSADRDFVDDERIYVLASSLEEAVNLGKLYISLLPKEGYNSCRIAGIQEQGKVLIGQTPDKGIFSGKLPPIFRSHEDDPEEGYL